MYRYVRFDIVLNVMSITKERKFPTKRSFWGFERIIQYRAENKRCRVFGSFYDLPHTSTVRLT